MTKPLPVQQWTTCQVLAKQAMLRPDKTAIEFINGPSFTFAGLHAQSRDTAACLLNIGFTHGDKIALMLPNCQEFIALWLGCHQANGIMVGLNTELVGEFLLHALNLSECRYLACSKEDLDNVLAVADRLTHLQTVVVVGGDIDVDNIGLTILSYSQFSQQNNLAATALPDATFSDLACLLFTSGTTGPSKAVKMPHAHCYLFGQGTIDNLQLEESDSYYVTMPLFHANGLFMQVYACLIAGATAVIRRRFSASNWIADISHYRVTHTNLLGVMSEFIDRQPATAQDKSHNLKVIAAAPAAPVLIDKFARRFGVPLLELYGMSEVNIPLYNPIDKPRAGSCGLPYAEYFEVRIADPATDLPVPAETVGEIQVRPKLAGGFMSGYYRMPEQTLEAFRNLWFHTGDAGKCDADGYFYFVDRIKDCLRRRGENISSYEVECAILGLDQVTEVAVIGVDSDIPGGEQEVMAIIVKQGWLSTEGVHQHCQASMPAFAVPRYIRFIDEADVPRTATNKIRKVALRQQGVTDDTWDALANT